MPRTYKRQLGSRCYKSYSDEQLHQALDAVRTGTMSLRKAHSVFNIPLGTLSNKMKKRHFKPTGHPTAFSDVEEKAFCAHIETVSTWGFPFDTFDIRMLAKTYLDAEGRNVKQFSSNLPSLDWAKAFLKRHEKHLTHRTYQNIKRSRAQVGRETVSAYFKCMENTLKESGNFIPPSNIFNFIPPSNKEWEK